MDLATIYADELSYIQTIFDRDNISYYDDVLLTHIDNAWRAIARYQWLDYDISTIQTVKADYTRLIALLAIAYFNNANITKSKLKGEKTAVTQQSIGGASVTFRSDNVELDSNGLTDEVKAALPPRKLRVI